MILKNNLDLVAKIAANSAMSATYKDKDGNLKEILPNGTGNTLNFDQFRKDISEFNDNPDSGGSIIPDGTDTSGGINIIPGSLSDGSLTQRNLEWSGTTSTTEATSITFLNDVGLNLNQVGDGLQFWGHMQRIKVTDGVKAAADTIPLNFDSKNNKMGGYYTTTSPIPFSINRNQLPVGRKVTITLNGVGEGLDDIVDHVSPTISFTFNQDKTLTVLPTEGHDLDAGTKDDTGSVKKNGSIYTFVVDKINNYSVQAPVSQLPSTLNLFTGLTEDFAELSSVNSYFDNINGMLEVTIDDYLYLDKKMSQYFSSTGETEVTKSHGSYAEPLSFFNIPNSFKIAKKDLIVGAKIPIICDIPNSLGKFDEYFLVSGKWTTTAGHNFSSATIQVSEMNIEVGKGSLKINASLTMNYSGGNATNVSTTFAKIKNIQTLEDGK